MPDETDSFLKAEEKSESLMKALEKLYKEASTYNTAIKELEVVRLRLVEYIDSSLKMSSEVHEIIKTLKTIGGPEILSRLSRIKLLLWIMLTLSTAAFAVGIINLLR